MNTRCGITLLVMLLSIDQTTRRKRGRNRASFYRSIEVFSTWPFFPSLRFANWKPWKEGSWCVMEKFSLHLRHPPQRSCSISIVCIHILWEIWEITHYLLLCLRTIQAYWLLSVQKLQTWVNSTNSFPVKTFSFAAAVENHMGELTKWIRSR